MQNRILRIDPIHSGAISTEIAESMILAEENSGAPNSLQSQIDRLRELEDESPSIVPPC